jgi:hypothetical protein
MPRAGTNIVRSLTGGVGTGTSLMTQVLTTTQTPTLQRAVVVDVITDLSLVTEEYKQALTQLVNNAELLDVLSVNCVIAKIVSANEGNGSNSNTILFPFYSSHFMLPVMPGEQVYVIYEDMIGTGTKIGYWMSRVAGYGTFEDPNYTHDDRRFDSTINEGTYTTSEQLNRNAANGQETFQNGGNTIDTTTLPINERNAIENPYDTIFNEARASAFITPEPVPRWKKRPPELVLQGANNALIMLGEDRNGPIDGAINDNPVDIIKLGGAPRQAGAIDIVAGRGRYLQNPGVNPKTFNTSNPAGPSSNAPLVIENIRGYQETDKNPFRNRREEIANINEGNPNPMFDAARVYVVQQSKVDENYGLIYNGEFGIVYPPECIANEQPVENGTLGRSYVVNKADHIRMIARREPQTADSTNIAGTVLIIREGKNNTNSISSNPDTAPSVPDGNLAYIYLNKEGKIQVEANEIYLGRSGDLSQPYVRYSVYKKTIETLQDQINSLRDHIKNLEETLETAFQTAIAVPYSNIPSLYALANTALREQVQFSNLDQTITEADDKIKNTYNNTVKSTKIYGE